MKTAYTGEKLVIVCLYEFLSKSILYEMLRTRFTRQAQVVQAPARQANGESMPSFSHCSVIDILESPVKVCQLPDGSRSFIVIIWVFQ
jgi:hypothetical protein